MKVYYLITVYIFLFASGFSQSNQIHGFVIDSLSHLPISNVNIIDEISKAGTTTDNEGYFVLNFPNSILDLTFSHVAYNEQHININDIDTTSNPFLFQLLPKTYLLNEFTISDKTYEVIYKKRNESIIDYEVYNNRIFFIVRNFTDSKSYLKIKNIASGDIIDFRLSFKPNQLFIDLFDNLNIVSTKDSAYQLILLADTISINNPISFIDLKECSVKYNFRHKGKYYFTDKSIIGDKIIYSSVNEDNEKELLYQIFDTSKVDFYYREMVFLGIIKKGPPNEKEELVSKYFNHPRLYFERNFMYNNICINFFKLDQKIYILDNLNNNIISFDENGQFLELKPLRDVSSNYIDLSNYVEFSWQKIIIIDSLASKLYLPMKNKNFTTLFELNPNTGILSKSLTLPHILVKKIRLHGDEVYYLYEKPGSLNEWALYKTRIL
ncbi:MAG TPA: carboxypeptidase-like regulatory domain-containing protein [Bacteroidales bacterium]|nr:carboxypeptidase-like regulatory domain-containing protein [Bacteroidales bacterium]HPE55730.1 carboxypeptidase-like regulatory domain-containing protein [Bacteroidales bacterium]HRX97584.1 carboxypeptidase-like regulatory domain-containing protein [Bacteroidales bacterium]